MKSKIVLNAIPLLASISIWYFALKPKQSEMMKVLDTIPLWQEQKGKILQDFGLELAKITLLYLAINYSGLIKS